jgi:hypothetical protein
MCNLTVDLAAPSNADGTVTSAGVAVVAEAAVLYALLLTTLSGTYGGAVEVFDSAVAPAAGTAALFTFQAVPQASGGAWGGARLDFGPRGRAFTNGVWLQTKNTDTVSFDAQYI